MHKYDLQTCAQLQGQHKHWAYNALDCTGTREVFDTLWERVDPTVERYYAFERALQGPALTMMLRGCRVDQEKLKASVKELEADLIKAMAEVNEVDVIKETWDGMEKETGICPENSGKRHRWPKGEPDETRCCSLCGLPRLRRSPFNPQSSHQSKRLFYTLLGLPELRGKSGEVTVDDDALSTIGRKHGRLRQLTDSILLVRDIKKQLGTLRSRLSVDGRWRQSVNVGAAWTGRFSSSKNPYGEGNNMANVSERHRAIYVSDPGYDLFYADLERAESQVVAFLSGDESYIEAHRVGDTHTYVARLLWPDLPWTGDLDADKAVALAMPEWDNVPGHDWRFQAKRIQHGSNYGLSPHGISSLAHIPVKVAKAAQSSYFSAFPGIRIWQMEGIRPAVKGSLPLTNPLGFRVRLFGRPWDEHTFKQGLAFKPQSTVAMVLNLGMWKIWKDHDPDLVQLIGNVYDAILGQVPSKHRAEAEKIILNTMSIGFPVTDVHGVTRECVIPTEIKWGKNWGKAGKDNPGGLGSIKTVL